MSKRNLRVARIVLVLLLALASSALYLGNAQADSTVVKSDTDIFSVRLPSGWENQSVQISNFSEAMAFGDTADSMQAAIALIVNGDMTAQGHGIGGVIGAIDLQGQAPAGYVDTLIQRILTGFEQEGMTLVQQPVAHTFGGQYEGELAAVNIGYVAVLHSSDQLLLAIVLSDNVAANDAAMTDVLESISIPAETVTQPQPTASAATVEAPATVAAPSGETLTVRSSDERVSLDVPVEWTVLDFIADQNILAYGDSVDAAQSRLYSAKPDLATETPISGNGGLIILYPMSQFNIDPQSPDLSALMTRALGNLPGYTVEAEAAPLEGVDGALVAQISGAEDGYLALIPFGDQIAYVTATGTKATFDTMQTNLMTILKSVHVPAVAESSGLGGLGGLETTPEATATVEPTAEATSAGLGGL